MGKGDKGAKIFKTKRGRGAATAYKQSSARTDSASMASRPRVTPPPLISERAQVQPVPHDRGRRRAQAGPEFTWCFRACRRDGAGLRLQRRRVRERRDVGRRDDGQVAHEPEEIHQRHEDGVCRHQEGQGAGAAPQVPQGGVGVAGVSKIIL